MEKGRPEFLRGDLRTPQKPCTYEIFHSKTRTQEKKIKLIKETEDKYDLNEKVYLDNKDTTQLFPFFPFHFMQNVKK